MADGLTTAVARRADARRCRKRAHDPDAPRPGDALTMFFSLALLYLIAATVVAVAHTLGEIERGRWLALHLALVGGVSQLVIGAAQFFSGAFLATDPPPRTLLRSQAALWNAGVLALVWGVLGDDQRIVELSALALTLALVLFVAAMLTMRQRSIAPPIWAVRWYVTCVAFLLAGIAAGVVMATGRTWAHGDLLSAHLALNLGGWLGTAIVGTLHTFHPSLTRSQLRYPHLQSPTWWCWTAGISALAMGLAFDVLWLTLAGWSGLLIASLLLAANVIADCAGGTVREFAPLLVTVAQLYLPVALALGLVSSASGTTGVPVGAGRSAFAVLIVFGWIGLTVLGSLLHLLSVLVRVRNLTMPPPRIGLHPSLAIAASVCVSLMALSQLAGTEPLADASSAALAIVYAIIGMRIVALAVQALRAAPLRV